MKEESCLLLMKSSERINLENSGLFLKSLIEEKMYSSQIDECEWHENCINAHNDYIIL